MVPYTQPPERHFGFQCIKCRATNFMGRRYACWMCIDYQICGICYDSGALPLTPDHKHFHPLEVHYARAEYELYFSGEAYSEANVPQSYKCAFCDSCGYTSLELYKHVSEVHRGHKDFDEYFNILHTRYTAESSTGTAETVETAATAAAVPPPAAAAATAPPLAANLLAPSPFQALIDRTANRTRSARLSELNYREAVRLGQQRRNALLEQQANNVLEELRASQLNALTSNQGVLLLGAGSRDQRQPRVIEGNLLCVRPLRTSQSGRVCFVPQGPRMGFGIRQNPPAQMSRRPKESVGNRQNQPIQMSRRPKEDNWIPYWSSSNSTDGQRNRSDRQQLASYADVVRQSAENPAWKEAAKEADSTKFLCARFLPKEKEKIKISPHAAVRARFTEALICSMLSEEHLTPKPLKPVVLPKSAKPVDKLDEIQSNETATFGTTSDDTMDRFYRGLDNYSKWLAEFTKSKNSKEAAVISALPNMTAQTAQDSILTIDSDVDNDTDDNGEASDGNEQQVDESTEIERIDIADDEDNDEDDDVEDEEDEDDDDDDDEDEDGGGANKDDEGSEDASEDGSDDGSGSETSDSTIAMMVNQIDQVYGSS